MAQMGNPHQMSLPTTSPYTRPAQYPAVKQTGEQTSSAISCLSLPERKGSETMIDYISCSQQRPSNIIKESLSRSAESSRSLAILNKEWYAQKPDYRVTGCLQVSPVRAIFLSVSSEFLSYIHYSAVQVQNKLGDNKVHLPLQTKSMGVCVPDLPTMFFHQSGSLRNGKIILQTPLIFTR